jgi:hypothetical protein
VQTQGGETGMLDTATGKWTTTGFASNGWGYGWGGMVVDPVLDELLYDFGGYRHGGDFFEGLHLTRNVRITHPYTWQGTPCRSVDQYRGMVIDESRPRDLPGRVRRRSGVLQSARPHDLDDDEPRHGAAAEHGLQPDRALSEAGRDRALSGVRF